MHRKSSVPKVMLQITLQPVVPYLLDSILWLCTRHLFHSLLWSIAFVAVLYVAFGCCRIYVPKYIAENKWYACLILPLEIYIFYIYIYPNCVYHLMHILYVKLFTTFWLSSRWWFSYKKSIYQIKWVNVMCYLSARQSITARVFVCQHLLLTPFICNVYLVLHIIISNLILSARSIATNWLLYINFKCESVLL